MPSKHAIKVHGPFKELTKQGDKKQVIKFYKCTLCDREVSDHPERLLNHVFHGSSCTALTDPQRINIATHMPCEDMQKYARNFVQYSRGYSTSSTEDVSVPPPAPKRRRTSENTKDIAETFQQNNEDIAEFQADLCKWVVMNNLPFSLVGKQNTMEFLGKWLDRRVRKNIPSPYQLSNTLVPRLFQDVSSDIRSALTSASFINIVTDAWSNLRNQSVTNFVALTPDSPVFFKAVHNKVEKKDANYVAQQIATEVQSFEHPERICGIISDNASVMKKAFALLQGEFPHIVFVGCHCHGINLFFNDVFGRKLQNVMPVLGDQDTPVNQDALIASVDEESEDNAFAPAEDMTFDEAAGVGGVTWSAIQPGEYTLPQLAFIATKITIFFRSHQSARETFMARAAEAKKKMLSLPGKTRWGSVVRCIKTVVDAEEIIKDLFANDGNIRSKIRNGKMFKLVTTDPTLFDFFRVVVDALHPLTKLLTVLESDRANLSFAFHHMAAFGKFLKETELAKRYPVVATLFQQRRQFLYTDAALAAYRMDTRYGGEHLTADEKQRATNYLFARLPESAYSELVEFVNGSSQQPWRKILEVSGAEPYKCWQTVVDAGYFPHLGVVAARLLFVACNSASSERIWSNFSFIHSKLRNRLTVKKSIVLAVLYAWWNVRNREDVSKKRNSTVQFHGLRTVQEISNLILDDDGDDDEAPLVPGLIDDADLEDADGVTVGEQQVFEMQDAIVVDPLLRIPLEELFPSLVSQTDDD